MLGHDRIGTGPIRVIVMNDWMADTSTWDGARRYLDLDAFTWVFADLRGYGRSNALEGPFDLGQSVTDILALADTLGWPQFNIVGHSMSTLVAMHLAQHHADRIRRVVVLTPAPPAGMGADDGLVEAIRSLALADDAARIGNLGQRWGDRLSAGWVGFKAGQWRSTTNPQAVADYVRMFAARGLPDPTAMIAAPVLAITGEEDFEIMRSGAVAGLLGPIAKNLSVVPFVQCSHYPMQEMPPLTVATVERFLRAE